MSVGMQVGAYRILEQIGEGGMGTVWVAEHMTIGRKAAVKMLHGEYSNRQEIVQRFFNEARAATQISDPGIVQIFDFGTTPEGRAYIVMELLDGEALDRRVQRTGKLAVHDALRIMRQVASTLGAAHARGIVHRDLKPENIYMVRDPEVPGGERAKILDFGIAKLSDNAGVKTQTNAIMGTPQYMSPEQCRGSGGIDARSDVYALGCVFFALVTGQPPFMAEGHGELIVMHIQQPAPLLSSRAPHVPAAVDAVVARCLAKSVDERYATATELAQAIGMLITSTSHPGAASQAAIPAHQQQTIALSTGDKQTTLSGAAAQAGTTAPATRGNGRLIAIGAVALLAIGGGAAVVATSGGESSQEEAAASEPEPAAPAPTTPVPAPAPPEPAAPTPEPTQPEPPAALTVAIPIDSTPTADVFVGNEKKPRGKTPFTLELDKGASPVAIKLVARGYHTEELEVSPSDPKVEVTLSKRGRPRPSTAKPTTTTPAPVPAPTTTHDSDDTMNPFAKKKP